jgi:hypothetical protein
MRVYAMAPAMTVTTDSKTVMTGRRIQSSESVIFYQRVWVRSFVPQQVLHLEQA